MKKGISLIILAITIIIIVIITTIVIYTLSEGGIIEKAQKARNDSNISTIKEILQIEYSDLLQSVKLNQKRDVTFDDFLNFKDENIDVLKDESNNVLVSTDENGKEYATIKYKGYEFRVYQNGNIININDDEVAEEEPTQREEVPYTTDGLVMRLSGYNNTVQAHNNTTNTWQDISGVSNVSATLEKGHAIWGNNSLTLDGTSYWRLESPVSSNGFGTVEIALSIDSDFSPFKYSAWYQYWYSASCIFGSELSGTQKEIALIITGGGNFAIGYSSDTIVNTGIYALDGEVHTLSYYYGSNKIAISIDGQLITSIDYTPAGNIPPTYGIGWNNSSDTTTIKGKIYEIRFYNDELTQEEIASNYNADKDNITKDLPKGDVINLINSIGTVNQDSGYLLNLIDDKYNALTIEDKQDITNYNTYISAKNTFDDIEKSYENSGLVMKLIGENNTGSGFSDTAQTWQDLQRDNVSATKVAGNVLWQNNSLRLDGSTYWAINSPVTSDGFGTVEVAVSIDSSFTPVTYSGWEPYWYKASCIFGSELSGVHREIALIITSGGNFAIGYSNNTIVNTGVYALDGNLHTLSYYYGNNKLIFLIDGEQKLVIDYVPGGNVPPTYGIGWNNSTSATKIKGNIYSVRFYNKRLSIDQLYKNYLVDKSKYSN